MMSNQEILNWIDKNAAHDCEPEEVARRIIIEAINNTTWAEDAYPGIKEKLINMVNQMEFL